MPIAAVERTTATRQPSHAPIRAAHGSKRVAQPTAPPRVSHHTRPSSAAVCTRPAMGGYAVDLPARTRAAMPPPARSGPLVRFIMALDYRVRIGTSHPPMAGRVQMDGERTSQTRCGRVERRKPPDFPLTRSSPTTTATRQPSHAPFERGLLYPPSHGRVRSGPACAHKSCATQYRSGPPLVRVSHHANPSEPRTAVSGWLNPPPPPNASDSLVSIAAPARKRPRSSPTTTATRQPSPAPIRAAPA